MKKNYLNYLFILLSFLPLSSFAQVKLAEWNFNYEYTNAVVDATTLYTPTTTELTASPDITPTGDFGIYPETYVGTQTDYVMTTNSSSMTLRTGYNNYTSRIQLVGPQAISDYTVGANHNNYYQFSFPTTGYDEVSLQFSMAAGQNNAADFLEAVYSTDGGTTWVDGGSFNALSGWWLYNDHTVSISAKNKSNVIVRLISATATVGSAYFYIDNFSVSGTASLAGTVVNDSYTISWPLETGAEGQMATYSNGSADYFKTDHINLGSNLGYAGIKTGNNSVVYTAFQPITSSSTIDETNAVALNVWPKTGLSFTPTLVEFDCERFGTGGGMIDVIWRSTDGTATTIGTDIKPNRVNYTDGVFHATLDLTAITIPSSDGECTLEIYITELGNTKQVGIANIALTGSLAGTIADIASYQVNASVSPAGAGTIASSPVGNEFDENTEVTLTASRSFGYEFSRWVDGEGTELSTANPYTFTLTQATNIVAEYNQLVTYSFDLAIEGCPWGEVVLSPEPTNGMYETGTLVSAQIVPNPVSSFLYWDDSSTATSKTITMDSNKSITATFDEIPFIVGWDFRSLDPKVARTGDFYSETTNTGTLSVYKKADESTVGWLAHSAEFSPSYPNARIWAVDFTNDRRYYMASFSTENYTNIQVKSMMIGSYQVYSKQDLEYSIDGTNFTKLATADLTSGYGSAWVDLNATLPVEAEGQTKVYVRWIADETSTILGSGNDGTAITNIFVFADKTIVNDTEKPSLLASVPAESATNASANGSIILTFNEKVIAGTGDCTLGSDALTAVFGAKTATFSYEKLEYNTEYTFTVPAGAITDQSGNTFDGTTLTFTTMTRPVPTPRLYDAVVALDGSGDYTTIQDAIDGAPSNRAIPWLIFIKNGRYDGHVFIPQTQPFIHLIGQSTEEVIISDDRLSGALGSEPVYHVSEGSTVVVYSSDCYFENITFQNAYGFDNQAGPQALAMYTNNDKITFKNCTLRSYQDTYLTSTKSMSDRHYLENCRIEGAVDYIYGAGDVFFDECTLFNTRPSGGYIVAPSHPAGTLWGYVFNHCIVDGNEGVITYYGRPWHNNPKTVFLYAVLKCDVYSVGWYDHMGGIPAIWADYGTMDADGNLVDLSNRTEDYYYEVKDSEGNVTSTITGTAKNSLTDEEAATYTYENVLLRSGDSWDPKVLTEATSAPTNLSESDNKLVWEATPYAMCYVITRNNVVIDFTTQTTYTDNTAIPGTEYTYTVQAASEYGALSAASEEASNTTTSNKMESTQNNICVTANQCGIKISGLEKSSLINVYNISGQVVKNEKCTQPTTEYNLPQGIYCVTIFKDRKIESFKVIVSNN